MATVKKTLIYSFAIGCFALIIFSFNSFNVSYGQSYLSALGTSTGDMSAGQFDLINLDFLTFAFTPLKMISTVIAGLSIVIILLTYHIYRKHYKKSNRKFSPFRYPVLGPADQFDNLKR